MDGMADLAAAVVKELRAHDGDLEIYVLIRHGEEGIIPTHGDSYKLQPVIRNGGLKWDLHAINFLQQHKGFKVVFDELDDVIAFIQGLNGCSLVIESVKRPDMFRMYVNKYDSDSECYSDRNKTAIKNFLMLCPKIKHCKQEASH